eukprot:2208950-Ditylum_brightwellii.AAC.1
MKVPLQHFSLSEKLEDSSLAFFSVAALAFQEMTKSKLSTDLTTPPLPQLLVGGEKGKYQRTWRCPCALHCPWMLDP